MFIFKVKYITSFPKFNWFDATFRYTSTWELWYIVNRNWDPHIFV